jgi:hypothetical protein
VTFIIPTEEPDVLRVGEDWHWTIVLDQFPPSEGWTLTYYFNGRGNLTVIATPQVAQGNYDVLALAAATAKLPPPLAIGDRYTYDAIVTGVAGETHTARSGVLTALPNLVTAIAGAFQTHAEIMLAAIETKLSGRVTSELLIEQYGVAGRHVVKLTMPELLKLRGVYLGMVRRERNPSRIGFDVESVFQLPD